MSIRALPSLTALLAIALVATPVSANPAAPTSASGRTIEAVTKASTRQIALGVSMLPFDSPDTYAGFKASVGTAPAVWSVWADWADGNSSFPTDVVNQLRADGTVPLIFWQPVGTNRPPGHPTAPPLQESCGVDYSKIISGKWDTYIHQWAQQAVGMGRILVRFAHEMDGGWFPFGVTRCQNTADKFKTMWKHVVKIFRTEGATNVKFVWSPLNASTKAKALYPGNKWVDYVGFTSFNWGSYKNTSWKNMINGVKSVTNGLKSYAGTKPWILAETGSIPTQPGHSRPSWLTTGYNAIYSQIPNIKIIMYFNVDMTNLAHHQPNWQLNTADDLNAYRSLLSSKKFQGKVN